MRLPNGYGSVIKLKGNRRRPFAARITTGFVEYGKNEKGVMLYKQSYKYLGYFETKKEALKCLVEYNNSPYDIDARKMSFNEVYNLWLESHKSKVSNASLAVYKTAYNKCKSLHNKNFADLRPIHFQSLIDESPNYSGSRTIKILANLIYAYAIKNEIVEKDYSKLLELPKKVKKKEKQPFTFEEINLILNNPQSLHNDMLIMLLYTGLRISELLQLESKNIDLENRTMVGGLKTENGIDRTIPIHKKLIPIIKRNIKENYLFQTPRGKHYLYSNEGLKLNRYIKSLGIERTIHETRHTFISQAHRLKIDPLILKRIVGHSSKDITSHYTHINNDDLIKTIDLFEYN